MVPPPDRRRRGGAGALAAGRPLVRRRRGRRLAPAHERRVVGAARRVLAGRAAAAHRPGRAAGPALPGGRAGDAGRRDHLRLHRHDPRSVGDGPDARSSRSAVPDDASYQWRVAAYDRFDRDQWSWSDSAEVTVPAGSALLDGTRDATEPDGRLPRGRLHGERRVVGRPASSWRPASPLTVDRDSRVTLVRHGADSCFAQVRGGRRRPVRRDGRDPGRRPTTSTGALTENRLRVAGDDYPPDLLAIYTDVRAGQRSARGRQALLSTILEAGQADESVRHGAGDRVATCATRRNFTYDHGRQRRRAAAGPGRRRLLRRLAARATASTSPRRWS